MYGLIDLLMKKNKQGNRLKDEITFDIENAVQNYEQKI